MVFKAAMSSDYSKITEISIVKEGVTRIDRDNGVLRMMAGSLRKFDVIYNFVRRIENVD